MSTDETQCLMRRAGNGEKARAAAERSPAGAPSGSMKNPLYALHLNIYLLINCYGCRSFGTKVKSEPGGFKAISRWLSPRQRAIPPGYERDNDITPEGCRQWGCDPSGVGSFPSAFRGCRPTASPPANGWHPSGMMKPCSRWDSSICSSRGNPRWSAIRSPFGALFQKICTQLLSLKYSISAVGHAELPPTIKTPQPSEGFTYNRSLAIIVLSASACKERARHGSATGPK